MEKATLELSITQINIILSGLGKLPLEQSIELFQEIHKQVQKQAPKGVPPDAPLADKVVQ